MKFVISKQFQQLLGLVLALMIFTVGILSFTAMNHQNTHAGCLFTTTLAKAPNACLEFHLGVLNKVSNAKLPDKAASPLVLLLALLSIWFLIPHGFHPPEEFQRLRLFLKLLFQTRTERFLKQLGFWFKLLQKQAAAQTA